MNEEKERVRLLGGVLCRIGNFNSEEFASSFDSRLIFQKTVYLLQAFGLYLGFKFSWYLRGPYSPTLAHDGYELAQMTQDIPLARFTRLQSERKLKQFIDFLGSRKNDPDWLEILASIHLLKKLYPTESKTSIIQQVVKKQPHFSVEMCKEGWAYLQRYGLIGSD